jgi:sulfonate transport system permease protein
MPDSFDTDLIAREVGVSAAEAPPFSAEAAAAPTVMSPARRRRRGVRLISPVVVVGLWQLASSTGILPASKLASPASIAHTAYTLVVNNSPTYGTLQ